MRRPGEKDKTRRHQTEERGVEERDAFAGESAERYREFLRTLNRITDAELRAASEQREKEAA